MRHPRKFPGNAHNCYFGHFVHLTSKLGVLEMNAALDYALTNEIAARTCDQHNENIANLDSYSQNDDKLYYLCH